MNMARRIVSLASKLLLTMYSVAVQAGELELRPALLEKDGVAGIEYRSGASRLAPLLVQVL